MSGDKSQDQIEATPEMIEAGAEILRNYRLSEPMHFLRQEAAEVYRAMTEVRLISNA